ncbi:EAL domain-containing protein [Nitrosospira sp. NpAV]|uniref:EAL domain-containing protein n=1 Tax=Nitrosospira sp. NpAV TaxID=58133 RepID=UPI000696F3F8|nr:EAL domain-containing protein [Nitrosospira sp. NpAV]
MLKFISPYMLQPEPLGSFNTAQSDVLRIEPVRLLYANLPTSIGANLVLALILVYVQRSMIDPIVLFGWLVSISIVSLWRTVLMVRWQRNSQCDITSILFWRHRFRGGVIASALVWGVGGILLFPEGNIPHQAFLCFVLSGLTAGGITSLSVDKVSVFSFLSLILIPLIVRFGIEGSEISLSMGMMTTLFLIVVSQNASRVGRTLHENIRLRIEASAREEALQEGKVRLQQLNQNLEWLVAERTSALGESEARFRFLFEQAAVGVAQIDTVTGHFVRVNQKYADIVGYTPEEMLSLDFQSLIHPDDLNATVGNMEHLKAGEIREFEMEERLFRKDDVAIWVKLTVSPMWIRGTRPDYHIAVIQDITGHKQAEDQIHQLAFYDPLTGLPNRRLFLDRLQQAQLHSTRNKTNCAILFIDLDNFKTLNDTRGHDIGDLLLIEVARRLRRSVRSSDTVARLGGDEFVVIIEGLSEDAVPAAAQAKDIGEKFLASITQPFKLQGFEYHGSSSIGIRLFHDGETSIDDLLKHADTAMYQAKTAGRNALSFFDPSMQIALEMRTAMAVELRQAIARQQFRLLYQKQVNADGTVVGAEVLLRWQHPERGMISPMVFIPIAEETGLIVPLGKWVLQMACMQLKQWEHDPGTRNFQLAVNISARQFRQSDFVEEVLEVLEKSGADPLKLKLELTESLVLQDIAHSIEKMEILCGAGIRFSLDDFGTGHSSLTYLKRLPLEQIKIDQSFVNDIATDPSDKVIVRTIIVMSNSLGMEVIAEGVETEDQRDFLARNGCYTYQGYLFGRPMPIEDFQKLVPRLQE